MRTLQRRGAWHLGQIDAAHYQRVADIKGVVGSTLPAGRALGSGEVHGLMFACINDKSAAGARDGAIVALGYAGGLRRAEIAGLDLVALARSGVLVKQGAYRSSHYVRA